MTERVTLVPLLKHVSDAFSDKILSVDYVTFRCLCVAWLIFIDVKFVSDNEQYTHKFDNFRTSKVHVRMPKIDWSTR